MIKLFIILLFLSSALYGQQPIPINGAGTKIPINGTGTKIPINNISESSELLENTIFYTSPDEVDGYNAFGYPSVLSNGWKINAFKKSSTHAAQGGFDIAYSLNGGLTSTLTTIKTGSGDVECAQLSFFYDSTAEFMYALSIDDTHAGNATSFKVIEIYRISVASWISNPDGALWTKIQELDVDDYDNTLSIGDLYGRAYINPDGVIRFTCHLKTTGIGASSGRHVGVFIDTDDDGLTWTWGATIVDQTAGGTFATSVGSELDAVGLSGGNVVVLWRNENYGYWIHLSSTDGGDTWSRDIVNGWGYDYNSFGGAYSGNTVGSIPVSGILKDGLVYTVIGGRGADGGGNHFGLVLMTTTEAHFIANTYNAAGVETYILIPEADIYSDVINTSGDHWGYPEMYQDLSGELYFDYYDAHDPYTEWLGGETKCRIIQRKIIIP